MRRTLRGKGGSGGSGGGSGGGGSKPNLWVWRLDGSHVSRAKRICLPPTKSTSQFSQCKPHEPTTDCNCSSRYVQDAFEHRHGASKSEKNVQLLLGVGNYWEMTDFLVPPK